VVNVFNILFNVVSKQKPYVQQYSTGYIKLQDEYKMGHYITVSLFVLQATENTVALI